jgi:hypothetical protein
MERDADEPDHAVPVDDGKYYAIGDVSGFAGFIQRVLYLFRLPAVARGGRSLWRVMVEGGGFALPVESDDPDYRPPTGFYTVRFVAARTRLEAESKAIAHVLDEWQGVSLYSHFTGVDEPRLRVESCAEVVGRVIGKGRGFTFFSDDS